VTLIVFVLGVAPSSASAPATIYNGSFETGDYSGWNLTEDSKRPEDGTWGIAENGEEIGIGGSSYDFYDKIMVLQTSDGLPITFHATNGHCLAYQLQNEEGNHRMYQDITLGPRAKTLSWDMRYTNWEGTFDPEYQTLAVHIRDLSDNILETLFITTQDVNPQSIPMTHFSRDISAYAGTTVRLDVEMIVWYTYFDASFDNFAVNSPTPTPGVSQWGIAAMAVLFGSGMVWVIWRRQTRSETH